MGDYVNCYDGNLWDQEFCPDNPTCTENCELEGVDGADWTGTYGVTETNNGHGITLQFVTHGEYSSNVGSRSYLLAPDEENYYMSYLPNKEFTFDVDVSNLPCGDGRVRRKLSDEHRRSFLWYRVLRRSVPSR